MSDNIGGQPLLIVGGPTAGGKSALSVALARALKGEVVNVDSVQIYRHLDIGSAKIVSEETMGVPHHLLDLWEPDIECNVSDYVDLAKQVIGDIQKRQRQCVVVGGTTMYLPALLHGLADLPKSDPTVRRELLQNKTIDLYNRLVQVDPLSARRIHQSDRKRIVRALEACIISDGPASQSLDQHGFNKREYVGLILVLCWPRDVLYQRIVERAALMVMSGLLQETRVLMERYGSNLKVLDSVGYRQARACLMGELSREKLIEEIAQYTRRLAKRQLTFWRNEPEKRGWSVLPLLDGREGVIVRSDVRRLTMQSDVKDFVAYQLGFSELLDKIKGRLAAPLDNIELWYVNAETVLAGVTGSL